MRLAYFEVDHYGNFRIVVDGEAGRPVRYSDIGVVEAGGDTYIGVSHYHPFLMPERVFKLVPVSTKTVEADTCNLFRPADPCSH